MEKLQQRQRNSGVDVQFELTEGQISSSRCQYSRIPSYLNRGFKFQERLTTAVVIVRIEVEEGRCKGRSSGRLLKSDARHVIGFWRQRYTPNVAM